MKIQILGPVAFLAIFLLVCHEFCYAKETSSSSSSVIDDEGALSTEILHPKVLSRKRRKIKLGIVLIGAALGLSGANIAVDFYLSGGGCCKSHSFDGVKACTLVTEIATMKKDMEVNVRTADAEALKAKNKVSYIVDMHHQNSLIDIKLTKIDLLFEAIILVLKRDVAAEYNAIGEEIKALKKTAFDELKKWTEDDFDAKFNGLSASHLGRLSLFYGVMGEISGIGISYLYKRYRLKQLANIKDVLGPELKTALANNQKNVRGTKKALALLGGVKPKVLSYKTTVAQKTFDFHNQKTSRKLQIAANLFQLVSIGVDAWQIAEKTKKCKRAMEKVKTIHTDITESKKIVEGVIDKVEEYNKNLTRDYNVFRASLQSDQMFETLGKIRLMVLGSSVQTVETGEVATALQGFIAKINDSSPAEASTLQTSLNDALGKVQYKYQCFVYKLKILARIENECKIGLGGVETLFEIIKRDVEILKCKNEQQIEYTSLATAKGFIKNMSIAGNFYENCKMNNKLKMNNACEDNLCMETAEAEAARKAEITVDELRTVCAGFVCPISPRGKSNICLLKSFGVSLARIKDQFKTSDQTEVENVYNDCP